MRVLITRPQGKGDALAAKLEHLVEFVAQQSVIEIKSGPDVSDIALKYQQLPDKIIFVSTNAVYYLQQSLLTAGISGNCLAKQCQLLAVGNTTAAALKNWLNCEVFSPQIENTEGLLALDELQSAAIGGKHVVIVRGVGGRELLAEQLKVRGAEVNYWQLYQRQAVIGQGDKWWQQWQQWQVNTIVVTSVAIVEALVNALPIAAKSWWLQQRWICASTRIASYIMHLGVNEKQIYNANGANDEAIIRQIKTIIEDHDV